VVWVFWIVFLALPAVPFAAGWKARRISGRVVSAGVPAALVWWLSAYHDNSELGGAERVLLTGSFALAYLVVWILCAGLGAGTASARDALSALRSRQRPS
jgi:hypothetical protein